MYEQLRRLLFHAAGYTTLSRRVNSHAFLWLLKVTTSGAAFHGGFYDLAQCRIFFRQPIPGSRSTKSEESLVKFGFCLLIERELDRAVPIPPCYL